MYFTRDELLNIDDEIIEHAVNSSPYIVEDLEGINFNISPETLSRAVKFNGDYISSLNEFATKAHVLEAVRSRPEVYPYFDHSEDLDIIIEAAKEDVAILCPNN